MNQSDMQAFLDSFPPHLEPVIVFNNRNEMSDDGSGFAIRILAGKGITEERAQTVLDIFGFIFCPNPDCDYSDESEMTLTSLKIVKESAEPVIISSQELDDMLKTLLKKEKPDGD